MKRAYVRPTMVGERFVANEYVAACGDQNKVYKFKCNAQDWTDWFDSVAEWTGWTAGNK